MSRVRMRSKWLWGVVACVTSGLVAFLLLYGAPGRATAGKPCPADLTTVTGRAERARCSAEKATRDERAHNDQRATVEAQPRHTTVPLPPNPTLFPGTPVPPGVIRAADVRIEPVDRNEAVQIPALRGSDSIWKIGAVPSTTDPSEYSVLYVVTRSDEAGNTATLATVLIGNAVGEERKLYNRTWTVPQAVGRVTITQIDGPTTSAQGPRGSIRFRTASGQQGRFDLATANWTFAP